MDQAVPVGICRNGTIIMNPHDNPVILEEDKILVFSEHMDSAKIEERKPSYIYNGDSVSVSLAEEAPTWVVIFGSNESTFVILHELPENVSRVVFVGVDESSKSQREVQKVASMRNICVEYLPDESHSQQALENIAKEAEHIIILNDHSKSLEKSDMETIFLLINLRDLRERFNLHFNITVEMQKESNQNLVVSEDHSDFLVDSSMSSLILAQLSESPDLVGVFRELLSNEGNELYLKSAKSLNLLGTRTVRDLRLSLLRNGYILLGFLDKDKRSVFNIPLDTSLELTEFDSLIVMGEK